MNQISFNISDRVQSIYKRKDIDTFTKGIVFTNSYLPPAIRLINYIVTFVGDKIERGYETNIFKYK